MSSSYPDVQQIQIYVGYFGRHLEKYATVNI